MAVIPFVLSRLGTERFGIWALFFAFYGYLMSLDFGMGSTLIRYIASHRPQENRRVLLRTLRGGLVAAILLGAVWALLIVMTRGWITTAFHVPAAMTPEALAALLVFALGVLLMFPAQALMAALQGFERLDLSNLSLISGITVQIIVLFAGLRDGGGLVMAAGAGVVGQGVTGLMSAVMLQRQLRAIPHGEQVQGPTWREMMQFGAAFQFLGVLMVLQSQSGRIVLGLLGNLSMVAQYELAFRVANAVYNIPVLMQSAMVPTVARVSASEGWGAVTTLFTTASRWIYVQTALMLGLFWVLAPDVVRVWLGPGHEPVGDMIRLWVVAYAVGLAYSPGVAIARGVGRPSIEIWSYAAGFVTNVLLAILWVPRYGTAGAIAAAVGAFAVGFVVFFTFFRRGLDVPLRPWFFRELTPRVVAGTLAVVLTSALITMRAVATHLPPPGVMHGIIATLLFAVFFLLLFLPLGDTQRLARALGQVSSGFLPGQRGVKSA